ncbi:hypothetical protein ABBQ32_001909 [Trebouxia sp. C0010 RCD-2024]
MHIEVGAILLTTHTMLSIHPATCTQRPATTTPNACCMQTEVTLPGSLTFRPVSSGMLKRCQQRSVVHNKARSSRRLCAVQQEEDELPPWARKEKERELAALEKDLPFGVYLLGSAIVAIAATGSWFELQNKNAIFGVLGPDNPFWSIILGFFGVSGFPTSGYLFYKAIQSANRASERADKADGY